MRTLVFTLIVLSASAVEAQRSRSRFLGRGFVFNESRNGQSSLERLGNQIFDDGIISFPAGQACAECHLEGAGLAGRFSNVNQTFAVQFGAEPGAIGVRRPPGLTYLRDTTLPLTLNFDTGIWSGGILLDGRSTGAETGDPLAVQHALVNSSAIFNDKEQNAPFDDASAMPASQFLVEAVNDSRWRRQFYRQFGRPEADTVALNLSIALAAYLRSEEFNSFTSKFDAVSRGEATFTDEEQRGFDLFMGDAGCFNCHPPPMFTNRSFFNLGLPENPLHPSNLGLDGQDPSFQDPGLGQTLLDLGDPAGDALTQIGTFKTPTLRNVDQRPEDRFVKAFGHNGVFKTLEDFVAFLSDREQFPPAETPENVTPFVGSLMLTEQEQSDVVAFLRTLTDDWEPEEIEELNFFGGFNPFNVFGVQRFGQSTRFRFQGRR